MLGFSGDFQYREAAGACSWALRPGGKTEGAWAQRGNWERGSSLWSRGARPHTNWKNSTSNCASIVDNPMAWTLNSPISGNQCWIVDQDLEKTPWRKQSWTSTFCFTSGTSPKDETMGLGQSCLGGCRLCLQGECADGNRSAESRLQVPDIIITPPTPIVLSTAGTLRQADRDSLLDDTLPSRC